MDPHRRRALLKLMFGASGIGLRSFASGIPLRYLLSPRAAFAADAQSSAGCADTSKAQFLILQTSAKGDPWNANVPGTYDDPKIAHYSKLAPISGNPMVPMAPTSMKVGGKSMTAGKIWSTLSQLERTCFFHHTTNSQGHAEEPKTLRLSNGIKGSEMLASLLASQLGPCLGTIQSAPVVVGAADLTEALTYQGRAQPILQPASLGTVLTSPSTPITDPKLRALRDQTVAAFSTWLKANNPVPGQSDFLDRYALSQTQLRSISGSMLDKLHSITGNDQDSQIDACIALMQLNVAPVYSVHIAMGDDNHDVRGGDGPDFRECNDSIAGINTLNSMATKLAAAGLQDKVTFASLNVFGRTLTLNSAGGRDHNALHHVTVMIGKNVSSSVIGGVSNKTSAAYSAVGFDSTSGATSGNVDVPVTDTFGSLGKTLGSACGLSDAFLDANIMSGKKVTAALA